jgi:YD repeat-containing protein
MITDQHLKVMQRSHSIKVGNKIRLKTGVKRQLYFSILKKIQLTMLLLLFSSVVLAYDMKGTGEEEHEGTKAGANGSGPEKSEKTCTALGVNANSGRYQNNDADVLNHGAGGSQFSLNRSFTSNNSFREGPFGFGWTYNFDIFLVEISDGLNDQVIIKRGDGIELVFKASDDGSFAAPLGRFFSLTKTAGNFELTDKNGNRQHFNSNDWLSAMTDPNGYQITLQYDNTGKLTGLQDSDDRSVAFFYNGNNKIEKIIDAASREFVYRYDAQNNLISVTGPGGLKTEYSYDDKHRLISKKDPKGVEIVRNTYDESSRVAEQFVKGGSYTFTYDAGKTEVCNRRNHCTIYHYDENGSPTKIDRPVVGSSTRTWDEHLNLTQFTDENNRQTTYSYDNNGNTTSVTDANNHLTQYSYEPEFNKLTSIIDPLANSTNFSYDGKGNLTQITNALGQVVRKISKHDDRGNPLE